MTIVLAGQPNCGKSTIFNAVAGYLSATANFPGTSLSLTTSQVSVAGREVEVVDLPGTYSLTAHHEEAERRALAYLCEAQPSVIVNVVDATRIGRSLELTLQLLELRRPVVVALNMLDEAARKGLEIDTAALARELGVPVVATVAHRGTGLVELFAAAVDAADRGAAPAPPRYDREVEEAAARVSTTLGALAGAATLLPARLAALKLLERDGRVVAALAAHGPALADGVESVVAELEQRRGWPAEQVVSGARHALAHRIENAVIATSPARRSRRERLDVVLMHPVFGLPLLLCVLAVFFVSVFGLGRVLEAPIVRAFELLAAALGGWLPADSAAGAVVRGVVLGLSGGVAIALPYLLPFLAGLSALEDSGYLPRIAYLLDGALHRFGLHGTSIVPLILGYGCSVPAVMSTRILEHRRDRTIAALLATMVPCSARTTVILGLVGAVLGLVPALLVYVVNIAVVACVALALQRRLPGSPPGLVLEVPDLRPPSARTMAAKTWLGLKEFILVAWPALIVASVVLGLLEAARLDARVNDLLAPLTVTALGLPPALGLTLVFGVLRKELALMMLVQALGITAVGTEALAGALTPPQVMAFALFVVFYVPCIATLAALWREAGARAALGAAALTSALALVIAVAGRFVTTLLAG